MPGTEGETMSESTTAGAQTPAQQLVAFKRLALQELAKLGAAAELRQGTIASYAARAGLPADFGPDGAGYKIPDVPDPEYGPGGIERAKFTQAALDEHDTGDLKT